MVETHSRAAAYEAAQKYTQSPNITARRVRRDSAANLPAMVTPPSRSQRIWRWYKRRRRAIHISFVCFELLYLFMTVPIRIAFFFNPHATARGVNVWTTSLTVYTVFDVLAELISVTSIQNIFNTRIYFQAARAVAATRAVGVVQPRRHQIKKKAQRSSISRASHAIAWSLNTMVTNTKSFDIQKPLTLEIIAMLPLELFALWWGPNSLHLLRFLKLLRLYRVPNCIQEIKRMNRKRRIIQQLEFTGNTLILKRLVMGLLMCHLVACIYMVIAHSQCGLDLLLCTRGKYPKAETMIESETFTCWAIEDQLVNATALRKYARALYWSCRTMITLGYYDVAPMTTIETIFAIVIQIMGAVFSTSLIATFMFVFRYQNQRKQVFLSQLDKANEFMIQFHVPKEIQEGVRHFYIHTWRQHRGVTHQDVFQFLPEHLRTSLVRTIISQRLQKVGFLSDQSIELINTLAQYVEHELYSPSDWIIETAVDGMYFILEGTIMIHGKVSFQVTRGQHFASFALLFTSTLHETARAITFCELYKLSYRSFHATLEIFYGLEKQKVIENMYERWKEQDEKERHRKHKEAAWMDTSQMDMGSISTSQSTWRLPHSWFRYGWEHFRFLFLTFIAYEVPYYIVFDTAVIPFGQVPIVNIQSITSLVVELFFTIDLVLRARYFAYVDPIKMITIYSTSWIFQEYRTSGQMKWDLLSLLPVATVLQFTGDNTWMSCLFRLTRMIRLRFLSCSIQQVAQMNGWKSKVVVAITLVLYVTISIHITGCLWFLMARFSFPTEWIYKHIDLKDCLKDATQYNNCSWSMVDAYTQIGDGFPIHANTLPTIYTGKFAYLRSIYWAIVALTTIGYGDIVAYSTLETFFAAIWGFFGGVINYAVVAAMSNLISTLTASSRQENEKMNQITLVLQHYRVSKPIQAQITRYFHQQYHFQTSTGEALLLSQLPQPLAQRISHLLHASSVHSIPLFTGMEQQFLYQITGLFRRAFYRRGEYLAYENNPCDQVFVMIHGCANLYTPKRLSHFIPVVALTEGNVFGMTELVLHLDYPCTVKTATIVEIPFMSSQGFHTMMEHKFQLEMELLKTKALNKKRIQKYIDARKDLD